jgi:hypothetical protein
MYYHQKQGDFYRVPDGATEADLWRAIIDVDQDVLKYTSLHLEYGHWDNNLIRWGWGFTFLGPNVLYNQPYNSRSAKVWSAMAEQKWNDKWTTYARYYHADFDTAGYDDTANWGGGIIYQLNPAVQFEFAYEMLDYGTGNPVGMHNGDDDIWMFRTLVFF